MKKITNYLRNLCLALGLFAAAHTQAQQCAANFTWSNMANGFVTFTSTSVLTASTTNTTFYWNFGNSTTYSATGFSGMTANTTYTANGNYVVTLFILSTAPTCSSAIQYTVTIGNSGGCALNANANYTQGSNGVVNFNNTTSGSNSGTTYSWNFGDNSSNSTSTSPAHTYSANGSYTVTLIATNNSTCTSTKTLVVNVNSYCTVVANYNHTINNNGNVSFVSTSTGTLNGYLHHWVFGDGGQTWGGPTTSHTYANGTYTAILVVQNSSVVPTCVDSVQKVLTITNNTCNLTPSFSQSMAPAGLVNFFNTSSGTNSSTTYTWNLGNGFTSNSANPSVTYASNGVYYVTLTVSNGPNCTFTTTHSVNVTSGNCVANSNFTLVPTNTPQYWQAIPAYPWNVSNAQWSWGDNTVSSFSMYASHQYSAAGMYTICLTVTVSCGATASTCTSYSVFKASQSQAIININVVPPQPTNLDGTATSLRAIENSQATMQVFPNPNAGTFKVQLNDLQAGTAVIEVFNLVGDLVYSSTEEITASAGTKDVQLDKAANGIYLLKVSSNNKTLTQKLVVNK